MTFLNPYIVLINADGCSTFEAFPGQTGRYQEGIAKSSASGREYFEECGIIDTETMTMPITYRLDYDISHLELQIRSIALAILNDEVTVPATPVAPDRYRVTLKNAHQSHGGDLELQCFAWPHEWRSYGIFGYDTGGPLLTGTLGTPEHPYTAGIECLTKIGNVLSACGYEFEFNTRDQFNSDYMVTDLPEWCPVPSYQPVSLVEPGYRIETADQAWDRFVNSLQSPSS